MFDQGLTDRRIAVINFNIDMIFDFESRHTNYSFHIVAASGGCLHYLFFRMSKIRGPLTACGIAALIIAVAYWVQPSFLYFPRRYRHFDKEIFMSNLFKNGFDLHTLKYSLGSDESQSSYLVIERVDNVRDAACNLIILFGGNGMTAFDWFDWLRDIRPHLTGSQRVSFLLVDYPGYGANKGNPSPDAIHAAAKLSLDQAVFKLKNLGVVSSELNVVGHSLGSAVAIRFVEAYESSWTGLEISRVILSAPFTSISDMVLVIFPLVPSRIASLLTRHDWDSRRSLTRVLARGNANQIVVVHGRLDEVVPFRMGEELAGLDESMVRFIPVNSAAHNDILSLVKLYGFILNEKL